MTPETAAARSAAALAMGLALGLWYDLLRPLRPRHTLFADSLFLAAAFWAWLELSFRICRGDIRMGFSAAMAAGWAAWQALPGRWIRPCVFRFWGAIYRTAAFIFRPLKIFFKKRGKFQKNSLQSRENGLQ